MSDGKIKTRDGHILEVQKAPAGDWIELTLTKNLRHGHKRTEFDMSMKNVEALRDQLNEILNTEKEETDG